MSGPLEGTRAVELAIGIQGPGAGLFFASMGADVVKVEAPMGELNRHLVPQGLPEGCPGPQFVAMNKGKRSIALDLHTPLGKRVMERLLESADVLVTNVRASALGRMGLDPDALVERHPRLVVGCVNGFGPEGPDAEKAMLDGAAQARGGLASLSGPPDGPPTPPGAAIADHAGALQLALGCVTALLARTHTGRGQVVRTSSLGAQLWLQAFELQHSALAGTPLQRSGTHHPAVKAPYGVYTTSDGVAVFFVTAMSDESWTNFWVFVDRPQALLLTEWDNPGKRIGRAGSDAGLEEIRALMRAAFRSKPFAEFEAFFASEPEIIWERVRDHAHVLLDPQNVANHYVVDLELPEVGKTKTVGALIDYSDTPPGPPVPPPALGAQTAEVMRELGFGEPEIAEVLRHSASVRDEQRIAYFGED